MLKIYLQKILASKDLLPVSLIYLIAFIFFSKGFFQNGIIWGFDTPKIVFPLMFLLNESLKHLQFPLWTQDIYFGFPVGSEGQIGSFYIFNFLHAIFPLNFTLSFLSWLHVSLAGIFTYVFCRLLGLGRFASLFAGIVFMFNGFIVAHMQYPFFVYGYAYLPIMLFLVEVAIRKNKVIPFIFAGAMFGSQLCTGHPNIPIMTIIYVLLYCLIRLIKNKFLFLKGILVLISVDILIALPQLLLTKTLLPLSIRSNGVNFEGATSSSFSFFDFITLLFPNFFFSDNQPWTSSSTWHFWSYWGQIETTGYVGIITLFLAPFSLLKKTRKKAITFSILLLISLILALGKNTPLYKLLFMIPVFTGLTAPGRFLLMVDFSLAILAGYGIFALFQFTNIKNLKINIAIISTTFLIFSLVSVGYFFAKFHPEQVYNFLLQNYSKLGYVINLDNPDIFKQIVLRSFRDQTKVGLILLALSTITILLVWNGFKNYLTKSLIIGLVVIDLFIFNSKVNIWRNFDELNNQGNIIINKLKNELSYSTGRVYTFSNVWSDLMPDQLMPHHIPDGNGFASLPLKRFEIWQKSAEQHWLEGETSLFSQASIKYVYDKNDLFNVENSLPRVYVTNMYVIAKDSSESIDLLTRGYNTKLLTVLESNELNSVEKEGTLKIIPAKILIHKPNYIKISSDARDAGILVLTDINFPGWEAFVNGRKVKIYHTNYLFRGILLPGGTNLIEFQYHPVFFKQSIFISLLSGLMIILLAIKVSLGTIYERK